MAIDPDVQVLLDVLNARLDALETAPVDDGRVLAIEAALQGIKTATTPF